MFSPSTPFVSNRQINTLDLFASVLLISPPGQESDSLRQTLAPLVGEISRADSQPEALEMLQTTLFELALLDLQTNDTSAGEFVELITHLRPGLPIIVLASGEHLDSALSAMRQGAWDYVITGDENALQERLRFAITRAAERKIKSMQEVELLAERNAFWAAVQTAQDGMGVVSRTGLLSHTNAAFKDFCQLLGHRGLADEPVNILHLIEGIDTNCAQDVRSELGRTVFADAFWSAELRIPAAHGLSERVFKLTLSSVIMTASVGIGAATIADTKRHILWTRDITQKKERERFQRDLVSTTSHDLKGPLGTIACATELIEEGGHQLPEEVNLLVRRIGSCAQKSLVHISSLLASRSVDEGALTIEPRWCNASALIYDALADYQVLAERKGLALVFAAHDSDIEIYVDKLALNRVLGNLISNALKFTPEGGEIRVNLTRIAHFVRLSVSDSGPGIDPTSLHKLFSRFGRLKEHAEIEGTGLGLFISKSIVDAHNGRIEVNSHLGEGAEFILYMPDPESDHLFIPAGAITQ